MSTEKGSMVVVTRVAAFAAAVLVALVFLGRFPLPVTVVTRYVPSIVGAIAVLSASWFLGQISIRACSRMFGGTPGNELSLTDSILVGVPIYGTLVAAIAWTGLFIRILIPLVTILLAAAAILPLGRRLRFALSGANRVPAILVPPTILAAIGTLMPVSSPDELIYKLSVPKAWLEWGRMVELPLNSNAYFPASIYSADLGGIVIGDGGAARMIHLALFVLALRVVWRLGENVRPGSGLWAATVFAWTPAILIIAGWAWAEWALLGLLLLSWHRFMQLVEDDDRTSGVIAALALAGAISAKYTAGPWVALFLPIAAILLYRTLQKEAWRPLLAFAAILAAFGGFFYLRNFVWTGSPLAPFGLPDSPAVSGFRSDHGGWWELLHGYDIFHKGIIDDSLGMILPVCVLISPLSLAFTGRRQVPFFFLGALQAIWLVTFAPTSRLMLLGLAPLVILGAAAAHAAFQSSRSIVRAATVVSTALMLVAQLMLVIFSIATSYEPFDYLVGAETEREYLWRTRSFARPYAWLDQATPPDSVILMLGETRAWNLDRKAHWAGNLDGPRVAAWLDRAGSSADLWQQVRELGVTHVLIHKEWYQVREAQDKQLTMLEKEFVLRVSKETDEIVQTMLEESAALRYSDDTYLIYELALSR